MKKKYVPALRFALLTPLFDRFMKYLFPERRLKADLLRYALEYEATTVLDFACGTGTFAVALKTADPALQVTGLDIDAAVLELADKKATAAVLAIDFDLYEGGVLPYQDERFDLAVSSFAFHHLEDPDKRLALAELRRVLKRGGRLLIADFDRAENPWIRASFALVRRLDGERITRANALGLIPAMIGEAGFTNQCTLARYPTYFGELSIIRAEKDR